MTRLTCEDTTLLLNRHLGNGYHSLTFGPYASADRCRPGQFLHVRLPTAAVFFRRAFSVASVQPHDAVEIIFKVFGRGTRVMAGLRKGDPVNLLGPLGVPFRFPTKSETTIIVAGGVGFPPLLFLAVELVRRGFDPNKIIFFYGGRTRQDVIERARIKRIGVSFQPVTEDGSLGHSGLVTQAVERFIVANGDRRMRLYACGPTGMLKAADELGRRHDIAGQLSIEAPMPCGIGVCLGCVVELKRGGYSRVCCDGPVYDIGEVKL
ncbi:MAG TPA: dihydroorotate dehydrogenase electron transfer subunit [Candidatus Deferrimicrobium sp.]|nr:dihydroorotate dehydrogenase electron transfer subunit [Candidatus Deferrimicrobium sp.]